MWEKCKSIENEIISIRRDLHRNPEIGLSLPDTVKYVEGKLGEMGIPFVTLPDSTGIIGTITGGKPGKTVALRADMDALPILEDTGLEFSSERPGLMHACGHDSHTAMLLGAAKILNDNKDEIKGSVKLLFQTCEEQSRGAETLIAAGALDGVDAVFGTHIGTLFGDTYSCGQVLSAPGCVMAAFDKFVINVKGFGCHGSTPEKGVDPVNIAAHIIIALQALNSREIAAVKPVVITIGKIAGGSQYNVIPGEVVIEGTIRTLEEDVRQYTAKRIGEIAKGVAMTFGGDVDFEMVWGAPPVINDNSMAELAARAAKKVLGEDMVIGERTTPLMGGEDFAYYLEKVPGAFTFLSTYNPEKKCDVPHHNPKFMIDEDVFWTGSAVFVSIVEEFLK